MDASYKEDNSFDWLLEDTYSFDIFGSVPTHFHQQTMRWTTKASWLGPYSRDGNAINCN